jgi:DNA-binding FrmR family transcriptional regulator
MRADKAKVSRLLKTARGQIDGILKMIEEDRYCIDISNQVLAAEAMLKKANREIIKGHMEGCIKEALESDDGDKKIEEFLQTLDKLMK